MREPRVKIDLALKSAFLSKRAFYLQMRIYSIYFSSMISSTYETLLSDFEESN